MPTKKTKHRSADPNGSARVSAYVSDAAKSLREYAATVPWKRVAVVAGSVAVAAIAVRAIGPRRIARGVGSLGIAHLAEKNADKLQALAHTVATRWWPRVYDVTASAVRKPAALIGRG